jgi:hypothetical protein
MNNKNNNSTNYINPKSRSGKEILKYMHHVCSEALNYSQRNGVESFEDFAKVVELQSQEYQDSLGDKALISAKTNQNGIVLQLKNYPEFGVTTGRKMQEHLGNDTELSRFTKKGIEESLGKVSTQFKSKAALDEEDLAAFDSIYKNKPEKSSPTTSDDFLFPSPNKKSNPSLDDLDEFPIEQPEANEQDFEFEMDSPPAKVTSKKEEELDSLFFDEQEVKYTPRSTKSGKYAIEQGEKIKNLTDGVDGTTFIGIGVELAGLAQVLTATYLNAKDRKEVENTIERLVKIQKRYKDIEQKTSELGDRIEEDLIESDRDSETAIEPNFPEQFDSEPTEGLKIGLTEATNKLIDRINKNKLDRDENLEPVPIDKSTNLNEQLKQINRALDRLEEKLSALESRIEAIEKSLDLQNEKANPEAIEFAENLLALEKLTSNSQKQVETGDELQSTSFKLQAYELTAKIYQDINNEIGVIVHDRHNNALFLATKSSENWKVDLDEINDKKLLKNLIDRAKQTEESNLFPEAPANELQAATATALLRAYQNAEREGKELNLGKKHKLIVSKNNSNRNTVSLKENENKDSKFTPVFEATETKDGWITKTDRLSDEQKKNVIKYFEREKLEVPKSKEQNPSKKTYQDSQL